MSVVKKFEIVPSILGKNFKEVKSLVGEVIEFVNWIQIDVSDGLFTSNFTWPYWQDDSIGQLEYFLSKENRPKFEIHLMIDNPTYVIEDWLSIKPDRIIFHHEAVEGADFLIDKIKNRSVEVGIALNSETPVESIFDIVQTIDCVQLMSIDKLGYYGFKFNEKVVDKVRSLRLKCPNAKISVDGGVNLDNAPSLIEAGVDNLIVGSAISRSENPKEVIEKFRNLKSYDELSSR